MNILFSPKLPPYAEPATKKKSIETYVAFEGLFDATSPTPPAIPKKNPAQIPAPAFAMVLR